MRYNNFKVPGEISSILPGHSGGQCLLQVKKQDVPLHLLKPRELQNHPQRKHHRSNNRHGSYTHNLYIIRATLLQYTKSYTLDIMVTSCPCTMLNFYTNLYHRFSLTLFSYFITNMIHRNTFVLQLQSIL